VRAFARIKMFEELMINVRKAVTSIIRLLQVYSAISDKFKITARLIFNKTKDSEIKNTLFGVTLCILALSAPTVAPAETGSFTAHFAGCTEFAGWGPVALAQVQPLVPAGYVIAGAAMGQAAIVVRATSCQGVAIGQSTAQPTELSQIGINLVAPDGTGDINNYTVIYVTNNQVLAEHFQTAGFPAVFDPELAYEYAPGPMETSGELYVAAAGQGLPAYFLFGTENDRTSLGLGNSRGDRWRCGLRVLRSRRGFHCAAAADHVLRIAAIRGPRSGPGARVPECASCIGGLCRGRSGRLACRITACAWWNGRDLGWRRVRQPPARETDAVGLLRTLAAYRCPAGAAGVIPSRGTRFLFGGERCYRRDSRARRADQSVRE